MSSVKEKVEKGGIYRRYIKRPMDFILSLIAIVMLSPVFVIVGILVRVKMGSPVLFKQPRPGKDGKIFNMYKFRTMTDKRDEKGILLSDNVRLTKFGRWLRSSSLDELPEIFLILTGKLSIVGPRPLLVSYLSKYNDFQKKRHEVRPGLTGHAQANGRNAISWEEKFELDVWYVDHITFLTDVKIIFKTVLVVFRRDGINSETSATMEYFERSEK